MAANTKSSLVCANAYALTLPHALQSFTQINKWEDGRGSGVVGFKV